MNYTLTHLQKGLAQVSERLQSGDLLSYTPQETADLKAQARKLEEKLAAVEAGFLTIGLIGGTGVGKSTLMNRLAGAPIAATSHRRPHTNRVLVYRHSASQGFVSLDLPDIPYKEILHQTDTIRSILLCDLPDFDSLVDAHRQQVLAFLAHLDLLVWMTTPEKYADQAFYDLLQAVPKAEQNFYFVFNKTDLLFEGENRAQGYENLERVAQRFQAHIQKSGIQDPEIYFISAREDAPSPWNRFQTLKQQIFRERDIKQILAIKSANLDTEIRQFFTAFEKERRNAETFAAILDKAGSGFDSERPGWRKAGQATLARWLQTNIEPELIKHLQNPAALVGPGYTLSLILGKGAAKPVQGAVIPAARFKIPADTADPLRQRLEQLNEKLSHQLLQENLPDRFQERLKAIFNPQASLENLQTRLSTAVALFMARPVKHRFFIFRLSQYAIYLLLWTGFLLALGGDAWRSLWEAPSASGLLHLAWGMINDLFSARGLAALGSFVLLNIFAAIRFYQSHRKNLRRAAVKMSRALESILITEWEAEMDTLQAGLAQGLAQIKEDQLQLAPPETPQN